MASKDDVPFFSEDPLSGLGRIHVAEATRRVDRDDPGRLRSPTACLERRLLRT